MKLHPMPDADTKTVQEYIDETPQWADGTSVPEAALTRMQKFIWILATAGKFFEGMVIFMTGVALPLIVLEFQLGAAEKGMIGAASLFGILVGATALGGLADRFGRKRMFIVEMAIFTGFLVLVALSPNFVCLVVFLFGMGLALGCDYPTAHMMVSETMPSRSRGRLVLSAFGFQAVGALVGTLVGWMILRSSDSMSDWRWMFATAILPALAVLIARFFISGSPHWLVSQGRMSEAEKQLHRLLRREPPYPKAVKLQHPNGPATSTSPQKTGFSVLFSKRYRKATILASVPWFLQDLGTYGIGIFTPTILATTLGAAAGAPVQHPGSLTQVIHSDMLAAQGAAMIDVLLIVGIVVAVFQADKIGRIRLQVWGFMGCAAGLLLAALSSAFTGSTQVVLIFAGFMLFNFMTNAGPNAMTYLIAGEVFPTHIRGLGAGFAASFAKIGACLTAFLFPILLKDLGTPLLLSILIGASLLGAWITARFAIETKGMNLEKHT